MDQVKFDALVRQFVAEVETTEQSDLEPFALYEKLTALNSQMGAFGNNDDVWGEIDNNTTRYYLTQPLREAIEPAMYRALSQLARTVATEPERIGEFRAIALAGYPKRFDLLAIAGDRESFSVTLDDAAMNLACSYYDSVPDSLFALVDFANRPQFRQEVIAFLGGAFAAIETATEEGGLVNNVMYGAVAHAMGRMMVPDFLPALYKAFTVAVDEDSHYELNLEAGTIALAMAMLGYQGDTSLIDSFLKSYEWRYKGDDFILKTRYALWLMKRDRAGAIAYLENRDNAESLGLVAASLSDMHATTALPVLKERLAELNNPVTVEVFKEAIRRLETQTTAPKPEDRMIRMFGTVSSTQLALGSESDNVFVQRAMKATKNPELGVVYEADNSAEDD